ncbi:MAG TPA: hypothetical protein VKP13_17520 [Nitrospira sp.]|nr:hypothetical protein [Nitrospira sp.]
MAKMKKRPAKKKTAKAATKRSAKKAARKPVSKMTAQKPAPKKTAKKRSTARATTAPKKKAVGTSVPAKPGPAMKKTGVDEEPRKTSLSKPAPAIIPKGPDLEEEGMGEEEIEISDEGEIEEEIEEELPLDGDEEDVDYLEKSEDLLDDSDEFRH